MDCFNHLPIHLALMFQSDKDLVTAAFMIGGCCPISFREGWRAAYFTCQEIFLACGAVSNSPAAT